MSDTTNNYGNVVNMNGGHDNVGINYGTVGGAQDGELRAAVEALTDLLRELRPHLTPEQDRTVEDALPELVPDRGALRQRGLVLASVAQVAAAAGPVGQSVVDAVGQLVDLLR
ncbi:hypothetical protein OG259_10365 [Streptomyces sp. NBC_00250]|uniref:hypothetical protein n=1 Tax=Streptomyces sp. NBC_00250 TaxID=2903641 RepID=UPI002E2E6BA7|nr:hypothetical protein [Streptomyces sp. NBC_00250]